MPCTVTYNGKEYSEAEFFAFLANGGLKDLIESGVYVPKRQIEGIQPPEPPKQGEEGKAEPKKEKRRFTQQVLKEYPELSKVLSNDTIFYDKMPNSVALEEGNQLIDYLGLEEAKKAYNDMQNGLNGAVRTVIGMSLIKRYQQDGDYDAVIEIVEAMAKRGTDLGREIQAMSMFSALTPEGQLKLTERIVSKQRETKAKYDKPKTDKVKKQFKKINQDTIDEVISSDKVSKMIGKVDNIQPKPNPKSAAYGAKNKLVTKKDYEKLKKQITGKFFSSIPPEIIAIGVYHMEAGARSFVDFSSALISDFGKKAKPYLRQIYDASKKELIENGYPETDFSTEQDIATVENEERGKDLVRRVELAIKTKNAKAMKEAISDLQKLGKDTGLWGKYKQFAVSRLRSMKIGDIQADIAQVPSLEDFTKGLVKNLREKIMESTPETSRNKVIKKAAIEIIADAYKNIDKYQQVWEDSMKEIAEKYKNEPEKLEALDSYYGEILSTPFSQNMLKRAVKQELKSLNINVSEVIKQHYTVYDASSRSLVKSLVDKSGLSNEEAKLLAEAVQNEFDRIATEKKRQALDKILSRKERKKPEMKGLEENLIRLTNLGAFSDEAILKEWADKMGYPRLTADNVKDIQRLANRVQESVEGFQKFRAIEDLLSYQANIKGVDKLDVAIALWYANILSGFTTQEVNFIANMINSGMLFMNAAIQDPKNAIFIAKGFIEGFQKGLGEGRETLRTGYSPIRGKVEVPNVLERKKFEGWKAPLNYWKYVARFMKASDVVVFEGLKEMRAYQLAVKEAAKEKDMLAPSQSIKNRATEILGKTDYALEAAQEQAELEYEQEISEIQSSSDTDDVKKQRAKQALIDRKRRIYEILEENRPEEIQGESAEYAARGTYNYKPEGALGWLASLANQGKDSLNRLAEDAESPYAKSAANVAKIFVNSIVPFTNIIANVANETISYTPIGFYKAKAGTPTLVPYNTKPLTEQERVDMMTKAIIGTSSMIAVYLLASIPGEDDEPLIEITANGTGDYRKNYELQENGWQPYSIRVGNTWISYQYSPLIVALSLIGNIKDYEKYRDEKLTDEGLATKVAVATGATSRTLFDMTFLTTLNSFLSAAMDPRNEDRVDDLKKAIGKTATSAVVPNIYTQTAKEVERAFGIPLKETSNSIIGSVAQHVPFARNAYYDKVNALGETIIADTDKFVSFSKEAPLWELLASKNTFIGKPSIKTKKLLDEKTGKDRLMTEQEYYEYSVARGTYLRLFLEQNYESLRNKSKEDFRKIMKLQKRAADIVGERVAVGENIDIKSLINTL